jgi:hypothetical protein
LPAWLECEVEVCARVVPFLTQAVDAADREVAVGAALLFRDREQAPERLVEAPILHEALRHLNASGDILGVAREGAFARLDGERVVAELGVDA